MHFVNRLKYWQAVSEGTLLTVAVSNETEFYNSQCHSP